MFIKSLSQVPCLNYCCYCKRSININGMWIYVDVETGKQISKLKNLSHGICKLCLEKFKKDLSESKLKEKIRNETCKGECNDCGKYKKANWED
jgi:hypothetical protein